jgi:flagellar basal body-associated protein FliL
MEETSNDKIIRRLNRNVRILQILVVIFIVLIVGGAGAIYWFVQPHIGIFVKLYEGAANLQPQLEQLNQLGSSVKNLQSLEKSVGAISSNLQSLQQTVNSINAALQQAPWN